MGFRRTLRKVKRGWPIVAAWIVLSTIACWLHNFLWLGTSSKFHGTQKTPSSSVKLSDVNELFSKDEIESLKKQYKSAQGK
jgi:hypothetical protein